MAHPSSEFNDPEVLRTCLQMLGDEGSKQEVRVAVETLLKLSRNLSSHPGDEKYRKIRKENKAIHEKLLKFDGAKEFLLAMGWTEIDDMLMYLEDHDLSVTTNILEEHLHTLPPPQSAATSPPAASPAAPTETAAWTEAELKQRDEKLEKEKKRRMEEYQRMKKEREAIKKQIKEDRKDTQTREVKDSHARQLNFGANVKKFENRGGG
ncbi:UBX domain-containing protein 6-like [Haliotis rubra]|uniref:UBX domain-containing protein 6-like n=2 Tax=Haliotis rubra TaxID=36100 RepID=UPI001EE4ECDE|nr:UBX domain-containing protein 6-like [Haliotis rubra]